MTKITLTALLACWLSAPHLAESQKPAIASEGAPMRIAVFMGDTLDSRTRAFTALVRARLQSLTTRAELHVSPLSEYDAVNITYSAQPSTHQEFRELARIFVADVVVDVVVQETGPRATARAILHYRSDAPPDTLRIAEAATDRALADGLARQLVARTRSMRRYTEQARAESDLPMRTLGVHAAHPYAVGPAAARVVQNAEQWDIIFRALTALPGPSVNVDWSSELVVFVAGPEYTTGPAELTFERARAYPESVSVQYRFRFTGLRNDYGSRPLGAVAISRRLLQGRVIRIHQLPPVGAVPTVVDSLPARHQR